MDRGIALHRSHGHEIVEVEPGVFRIPSTTGRGFYRVNLDAETCECRDFENRRCVCLHLFAATIFTAKRKCRKTTDRPQRRHGQPSESPGDSHERPGGNRTPRQDTPALQRPEGSLRGILVDPARLAQTAEKLGV